MTAADRPFPLSEDDPRTKLWSNGRRVTAWWTETPADGSAPFFRRWVRTADGWDYEDEYPWER